MRQTHFVYHDFITFVRVYDHDIVYVEKPNSCTDNQFHDMWYSDQLESIFHNVLQKNPQYILVQGTSAMSSVYKIEFLDKLVEYIISQEDKPYSRYSRYSKMKNIEYIVKQYTNLRENIALLNQ